MTITLYAAETATAAGGSGGPLFVLMLAGVGSYLVSLLLHPHTHCRTCEGTLRSYGSMYTDAFRLCSACGGRGRQRRLGARLLGIGSD